MDQIITQLGVGGIFAILLIREFANFALKKKDNGYPKNHYIEWERQKILEEVLRKLTHAINNQSQVLQTVVHTVKETRDEIKEVSSEVKEFGRRK